jgi:signal transduction histidine kinase
MGDRLAWLDGCDIFCHAELSIIDAVISTNPATLGWITPDRILLPRPVRSQDMRRTFTVPDAVLLRPEEQRRRLLRDLHDSVGPTLAAAVLGVHAVRTLIHKDRVSAEKILARLEEELHSAIAEIRRLANGVHPPVLERIGFVAAVRQYAETLSSRMSVITPAGDQLWIDVEVCGDIPALPAAVEVAAYRIVCEALANVSRHSDARRCTVGIRFDGELRLEIVDDGAGGAADRTADDQATNPASTNPAATNPAATERPGGTGLGSMRERACSLGGELAIEAPTLGGTRVAATLPVRAG